MTDYSVCCPARRHDRIYMTSYNFGNPVGSCIACGGIVVTSGMYEKAGFGFVNGQNKEILRLKQR